MNVFVIFNFQLFTIRKGTVIPPKAFGPTTTNVIVWKTLKTQPIFLTTVNKLLRFEDLKCPDGTVNLNEKGSVTGTTTE